MNKQLALLTLILPLAFFSFISDPVVKETNTASPDVYRGGTVRLELILNHNNTFHFINESDPENKINVQGKWIREGNKIKLTNYKSTKNIPDKWKIDTRYNCIKSKMTGFEILRLCKD